MPHKQILSPKLIQLRVDPENLLPPLHLLLPNKHSLIHTICHMLELETHTRPERIILPIQISINDADKVRSRLCRSHRRSNRHMANQLLRRPPRERRTGKVQMVEITQTAQAFVVVAEAVDESWR
jgi:hypothetical protein